MKKILNYLSVFSVLLFIFLIIINPQICKDGVISGILLCGRIIIPSLFPFTVCVLFILKSGVLEKLDFLNRKSETLTGLTAQQLSIMILSFIGGYPIGAKLLNDAVITKKIAPEKAGVMLNFCINAGPAFIIAAVGNGMLGSKQLGIVLFVSHITASLLLCAFSRKSLKSETVNKNKFMRLGAIDNFVISVGESAQSVLGICGFVILFSAINSYINFLCKMYPALKPIMFITEITNGINSTNNIYIIAFLLGLGGVCIWCQILAVSKEIKVNFKLFFLFRFLHAVLSSIGTYIILKFFNITVPVFSNYKNFDTTYFYSTPILSISMLSMIIIFIISITAKKYTGKIIEDVL